MQGIRKRQFLSKFVVPHHICHIFVGLLQLACNPLYHIADEIEIVCTDLLIRKENVFHRLKLFSNVIESNHNHIATMINCYAIYHYYKLFLQR